ncbi:MAG: DUF3592 domain-containing protein [Thiobacillaceae bacterium]
MLFNRATLRQRLLIGCIACAILIPVVLSLNNVPTIYRLSKSGEILTGTIKQRNDNPSDRRAYSTYEYRRNDVVYEGVARGVSGYSEGQQITLTVDRNNPKFYWVGNAGKDLWGEVIESMIGAIWLSVGVAFLFRWPLFEK